MKYLINNREYNYDELVGWDDAISESGFYFERAKFLGLPNPPACFVYDDDELRDDREFELIGTYHGAFKDAEEKAVAKEEA